VKLSPLPATPGQDEETPLAPLPTDAAAQQPSIDPVGSETFRAVVGGIRNAGQGVLETAASIPDPVALGESLIRSGLSKLGAPVSTKNEDQLVPQKDNAAVKKMLTLPEVEENQTTVGAVSRELVKWITGTAALKAVPGVGPMMTAGPGASLKAKIGFEMVESAVAGYIFTDPHAKNLGNLLEQSPMLQGPITDFMAQDDASPDSVNKLRGALENMVFAPLITPVVHYLGAWRAASKLKAAGKAEEAAKVMEEAAPKIEEAMIAAKTEAVPENLIAEVVQPTAGEAGAVAKKFEIAESVRFRDEKPHAASMGPNDTMIVAKDASGKDMGYLWYTKEEGGGFSVRKVFTAAENRKAGVAEELYQQAFETAGPYKGSTAQTAEGAAMVKAFKTKHPEWFVDPKTMEGVTQVADKPSILSQIKISKSMAQDGGPLRMDGTLNYAKFDSPNAIKQTIADTVSLIKKDLPDVAGTVQTKAETIALAKWLGKDPNDLFQTLVASREGAEDLGAKIVAGRALLQRMGKDIHDLATKMDSLGGGTQADQAGFAKMVDVFTSTIDHISALRTEAARATSAGRYKVGMLGITTDNLADLVEKVGGSEYVAAMAKRIRMSGPDAMGTAVLPPKNIFQKAVGIHNYLWMNGLLSSVKTSLVNLGTTTFNAGLMPGYRMIGGLMQEMAGNEAGRDQMVRGLYQYKVLSSTIFDSLKLAKKAWDANGSLLDAASSPLEMAARLDPISDTNLIHKAGMQWLGTAVGLPGRFLSTQDEFFKQVVYRSHVKADAFVDGLKQGLDGTALEDFVEKRMLASVNEFGKGLDNEALTAAKSATFTSDLAAKGFLFDRSIAEMLEQGLQQHPLIKGFVLPFLKVPTNLFRQAWEMTPILNMARKEWVEAVRGGGENGAMALGKMGAGGVLWAAAGTLAYQGRLTGGGPKDPELRRLLGPDWKPYSFVSYNDDGTKNYTSFARFDPFSYFFGLAADAAEVSGKLKDDEWDELTGRMGMALMANMSSKTYMRSITDALAALSGDEPALRSWLRGRVASYVPGAVQVLQSDDEVKNLRNWYDGFIARVPGWSQSIESKRDNFGEKVLPPMGYPYNATNPFVHFRGTNDLVRLEMKRLAESDSAARFPLPSPTILGNTAKTQVDLREIKNEKGQSFYDRWLELHSTLKIGGKTLHESLENLMQSDMYKRAAERTGSGNALYKDSLAIDLIDARMEMYKTRTRFAVEQEFKAEGKDVGKAMRQFEIGKATTRARGSENNNNAPGIDQLRDLAGQR
jgi:hypothetical protein